MGFTASYLNYLPAPCLASKAAVLRAFSLVALAVCRRFKIETKSTRFDIHQSKPKGAVPQLHVNQTQIDFDKGEKPKDKASYHVRGSRSLFIILVPIALFSFLSWWCVGTKNDVLFVSRAKTPPAMRREKGYGYENTSLYRELHVALLLWNT